MAQLTYDEYLKKIKDNKVRNTSIGKGYYDDLSTVTKTSAGSTPGSLPKSSNIKTSAGSANSVSSLPETVKTSNTGKVSTGRVTPRGNAIKTEAPRSSKGSVTIGATTYKTDKSSSDEIDSYNKKIKELEKQRKEYANKNQEESYRKVTSQIDELQKKRNSKKKEVKKAVREETKKDRAKIADTTVKMMDAVRDKDQKSADRLKSELENRQRLYKENVKDLGDRIESGTNSIGYNLAGTLPTIYATAKQTYKNVKDRGSDEDFKKTTDELAELYIERNIIESNSKNGIGNIIENYNRTKELDKKIAAKEKEQDEINSNYSRSVPQNSLGIRLLDKGVNEQEKALEGLGDGGRFVGSSLISMGNTAATLPLAAINPAIPMAIQGAQSGAQKMYDVTSEGKSAGEAFTRGLASGGIGYITNKMPTESIVNIARGKGSQSLLGNLAKQSLSEGLEEGADYSLNYLADKFAGDENARFDTNELLGNMAGGALGGLGFGLMGTGLNYAQTGRIGGLEAPESDFNLKNSYNNFKNNLGEYGNAKAQYYAGELPGNGIRYDAQKIKQQSGNTDVLESNPINRPESLPGEHVQDDQTAAMKGTTYDSSYNTNIEQQKETVNNNISGNRTTPKRLKEGTYSPSTQELIQKPAAKVTKIKSITENREMPHSAFTELKKKIVGLVKKEPWYNAVLTNNDKAFADIFGPLEARVTDSTLRKATSYLGKYGMEQVEILQNLNELFENGTVINMKNNEKTDTQPKVKRVITLLSPIEFSDGRMGVVKINVKEHFDPNTYNKVHENKILDIDEIELINTKKGGTQVAKSAAIKNGSLNPAGVPPEDTQVARGAVIYDDRTKPAGVSSKGTPIAESTGINDTDLNSTGVPSEMNVSDMLKYVKGDDVKYLPEDYRNGIDINSTREYNNNIKNRNLGGDLNGENTTRGTGSSGVFGENNGNDGTGSQRGIGQGMAGRYGYNTEGEVRGHKQPGNIVLRQKPLVNEGTREKMNNKGIVDLGLRDSTNDNALFSRSLDAGKASNEYGAWVDSHDARELDEKGTKTFLSKDNSAGVAVEKDGNITGVFKNSGNKTPNAVRDLLITAIEQGGNKLDCYGQGLVDKYTKLGFIPVARMDFNPEYVTDEKLLKLKPDVYFFVHNGDSADTVVDNIGKYKMYSKAELDQLPTFTDYDEALKYRDSILENMKGNPTGYMEYNKDKSEKNNMLNNSDIEKESQKGDSHSKFADSIENKQKIYDDEFKKRARQDEDIQSYKKITNKESLEKAEERINKNGEKAYDDWIRRVSRKGYKPDSVDVAEGFLLMKQLQDKGDYESEVDVAERLREIGTSSGQSVQAFSIMSRMSPEGMVKYAQGTLDSAFKAISEKKSQSWIDKNEEKYKLSADEVKEMVEHMEKAKKLPDGREKDVEAALAMKVVQDKMPSTFIDKLKAYERVNMLLNTKTMVRNVLGNVTIAPVNFVGDTIGSGIDKLISKKTGVRTKGGYNWEAITDGIIKGAKESVEDYKLGINTRDMDGDRYEIGSGTAFKGTNPLSEVAMKVEKLTSALLDLGDRPIYEAAYENSLRNQMKLNSVAEANEDMIKIANTEALQRTWQDSNKFTQAASFIRNGLNQIGIEEGGSSYGLGNVVMPFVKTPANLAKAVIDYSPIGVAKALSADLRNLNNAMSKGKGVAIAQHKFVDDFGKGIAGSLCMIIAKYLAKKGIITGSGDDDKDVADFEKNVLGIKPWSVKIGDTSVTYDWATPIGTTMGIMAEIEESRNSDNNALTKGIIDAIAMGGNTLFEQSMLQGISELFGTNGFAEGISKVLTGAGSRWVPLGSTLNQIGKLTDDTARTSYEYNQDRKTGINRVKAMIPGVRESLAPQVDVMGKEVKNDQNAFNIFLNPSNVGKANKDEVSDKIYSLYKATGDKSLIPPKAPYYFMISGSDMPMTSDERADFQKTTGKIISKGAKKLFSDSEFNKLSDDEKSSILKKLYEYATATAKVKTSSGWASKYGYSSEMAKVSEAEKQGISPEKYFYLKNRFNEVCESNDDKREFLNKTEGLKQEEKEWIESNVISTGKNSKSESSGTNGGKNSGKQIAFSRNFPQYTEKQFEEFRSVASSKKTGMAEKISKIQSMYPGINTQEARKIVNICK